MTMKLTTHLPEGNSEDAILNPSPREHFQVLLERRFSRRELLHGSLRAAFAGFVASAGLKGVNTRMAADTVGATPMDRAEWGAIHPMTGEVFFTLTNNGGAG